MLQIDHESEKPLQLQKRSDRRKTNQKIKKSAAKYERMCA